MSGSLVDSVVNPLWLDRPALEAVDVAVEADRLGYTRMWIGEMATWDAFVLAQAILGRTEHLDLVVGPLAVTVRSPANIATGIASLAQFTARRIDVAIGSSSKVVVQQWHGRRWGGAAALEESASALRVLLDGGTARVSGSQVSSNGYRLRLEPPRSAVCVAAFGRQAIGVAAAHADRMVVNLVSPELVARLRDELDRATSAAGRPRMPLAAWIPVAVDPAPEALRQIAHGVVAYLGAPGYSDMFRAAGFDDIVDMAAQGAHPKQLLAEMPTELLQTVSALGGRTEVLGKLAQFRDAGVDEVAIVPATMGDERATRTLSSLGPNVH